MGFDVTKRPEFIPYGLGVEWPPVGPLPSDPTIYQIVTSETVVTVPAETNDISLQTIGPSSRYACGEGTITVAVDGAWNSANRAQGYPVSLPASVTFTDWFVYNGSTVNGNFDLGIIDGTTYQVLTSTGSTAQSGTSAFQKGTLSSPYTAVRGHYYFFMAADSATAKYWMASDVAKSRGCLRQAAGFPLSTNLTAPLLTKVDVPIFGFSGVAL